MNDLDRSKLRRLNRLVLLARCVVLWERLWPRLWPFMILSSLFVITSLFDLFSAVAASLHLLILGSVLIGGLALVSWAFRGLDWPTQKDGLHRLESDSHLENQPLFMVLDRPAGKTLSKTSQAIWLHHQKRMAQALDQVTLSKPRSHLWKKDPYSFRAFLILLLVLGAIEARFDWQDRLVRALMPNTTFASLESWKIQAWITPPAHTGWSPDYLEVDASSEGAQSALKIAQHSKLLLRLEGRPTRDELSLSIGPFHEKLENLGKGVFSLETQIDQGEKLVLQRNNKPLYQWPVEIVIDQAPKVALKGPPQAGFRGHLSLEYQAEDDYGLKEVSLEIQSLEDTSTPAISLTTPLNEVSARGSFRRNLADHPFAGRDVVATPKAVDNAGQAAFGQAVRFILPERKFKHPLALQLVNIRKSLYDSLPEDRLYARLWIDRILEKPDDFDHQIPVYFALRVATDRLHAEMLKTEVATVQAILWQTAVLLDEGLAGTARNQLEFMTRQMQEMMQGSQQKAAMEALFEQMRQSLDQYLQQMSKANGDLKAFEEAAGPENVDMVGRDELLELLERARELMRTGNMKAAEALMEQFQSILSRLQMQKPVDPAQAKAAKEIMENLRAIQQSQQDLMDRTFQRTRNQDRPSIASTKKAIEQSEEQQLLQQRLQAEMDKLKAFDTKVPDALRDALSEMRRAAQSLQRGLDENAVQAQMRAVDHLNEGLKESATSLAQKMGRSPTPRQLPGYDPFGRGLPARLGEGGEEMVPSEGEMHQSREILQELYRRAGQKGRTDQELKYIERLLERF